MGQVTGQFIRLQTLGRVYSWWYEGSNSAPHLLFSDEPGTRYFWYYANGYGWRRNDWGKE